LPILFGWFEAEKKPQGFHSQGAFFLTAPSVNHRSVVYSMKIVMGFAIAKKKRGMFPRLNIT